MKRFEVSWQEYETYVFSTLSRLIPGAKVERDIRLPGIVSGRQRQVDVLVRKACGPFELTIAVDCKHHRRKVTVSDVDRFLGTLEDVRISKGVLVSAAGYTKSAYRRAEKASRDIELKIIDAERLSEFQHIGCALLWKGSVAALCSPPSGWVVDNQTAPNSFQFSMYLLGHSRESAMRHGAFLYGNIVLKTKPEPTMEAIASRHEVAVLAECPGASFERLTPIKRESWAGRTPEDTIFRIGRVGAGYRGPEYSVYIDHPEGVLVLVLLCPEGEDRLYVPALKWVATKALMMECSYGATPPAEVGSDRIG